MHFILHYSPQHHACSTITEIHDYQIKKNTFLGQKYQRSLIEMLLCVQHKAQYKLTRYTSYEIAALSLSAKSY
jgi:hypothetical protein